MVLVFIGNRYTTVNGPLIASMILHQLQTRQYTYVARYVRMYIINLQNGITT